MTSFEIASTVFSTARRMDLFCFFSDSRISPASSEYLIALSSSIDTSCPICFSLPTIESIGATSMTKVFPRVSASAWKDAAVSLTTSERGNSIIVACSCSSMRDRKIRSFVSSASRAVCWRMSESHSLSPRSISRISASASMMVMGVLISCPASEIKRLCFS